MNHELVSQNFVSRRRFLAGGLAAGAALLLPTRHVWSGTEEKSATPGGFRFVHLTDIHVQPERRAGEGMAQCIDAVEKLDPKPDFILAGGDLVYDIAGQGLDRAKMLFGLYKKILADHTGLATYACFGNHDVLAWAGDKGVGPEHVHYGKKLMQDELEMPQTYFRFDHKGWRFYVLDSIQPVARDGGFQYRAGFDDVQYDWLKADLAEKDPKMPAVVLTHIPILSVTGIRDNPRTAAAGFYRVGGGSMFMGAPTLTKLFAKHNVKLALSGHLHEIDHIEFGGVTFICDGAVCGGWWHGPNVDNVVETQEGFGIIDVMPDGTFKHQYFDYGWTGSDEL